MLNDIVKDFYSKSINFDCSSITLTKKSKSNPLVYKGPGEIKQDSEGNIIFKLFVIRDVEIKDFDFLNNPEVKLGEIIPETYYYKFEAIDFDGNHWLCSRVDISQNISTTVNSIVITGMLNNVSIQYISDNPIKFLNFIYFKGKLEFPTNKAHFEESIIEQKRYKIAKERFAEIIINDYKFTMKKKKEYTYVEVENKLSSLEEYIFWRLFEGIQFLFSKLFDYIVYSTYIGDVYTLRIRKTNSGYINFKRPISNTIDFYQKPNDFWKLLSDYLIYTMDYTKLNYSPLFRHLYTIFLSSGSTIMIQSLIVSITIDNVLGEFFDSNSILKEEDKKTLDDFKKYISEAPCSPNFKPRVIGVLNILNNTTSKSKLKDLQKHYVISDTEIKKYYKLRQLTVHYDENSSLDTAKMLNLYYSSLMLLYKLIFIKINYSGYYIDYSETNLPLKMFKREEAPNKQLHDKQEEK